MQSSAKNFVGDDFAALHTVANLSKVCTFRLRTFCCYYHSLCHHLGMVDQLSIATCPPHFSGLLHTLDGSLDNSHTCGHLQDLP